LRWINAQRRRPGLHEHVNSDWAILEPVDEHCANTAGVLLRFTAT